MKVTYYPARKGGRGKAIERILLENHVQHELIRPEEKRPTRVYRAGDMPAVEVDGRLFINPNDHALRKILELESSMPSESGQRS